MLSKAVDILRNAKFLVCLLGAGASVPSGIPDFRSSTGLYSQNVAAEEILSASYFSLYPEKFYAFYKKSMLYPQARPNAIHYTLAKWEAKGRLRACLTQNIDGLELLAGLKTVLQLHGTVTRNHCLKCNGLYDLSYVIENGTPVPLCTKCGGIIKPDVVLYEEPLDQKLLQLARNFTLKADVLLVIGTSLRVYPVAGLLNHFNPSLQKLIILNKDETPFDREADVVLHLPAEQILPEIDRLMEEQEI